MKVRRIIFGLAIATAFFGVVGCKNNDTTSTTDVVENDDLTSYEKVKKYASSFSIENKDEIDISKLTGTSDMKKVKDMKGNPLLLFVNSWSVGMTLDRNKGLILSEFSRN